jgi:hypothetical protein
MDNQKSPDRQLYYAMVLATVIFVINGEVQMLDTQFFSSSEQPTFPARRLNGVQNVAAMQIHNKLQAELPAGTAIDFKCLEVHIKSIIPCGQFTPAEFWSGLESTPGAVQEGVEAVEQPVAAGATVGGDNVVLFNGGTAAAPAADADTNEA